MNALIKEEGNSQKEAASFPLLSRWIDDEGASFSSSHVEIVVEKSAIKLT